MARSKSKQKRLKLEFKRKRNRKAGRKKQLKTAAFGVKTPSAKK